MTLHSLIYVSSKAGFSLLRGWNPVVAAEVCVAREPGNVYCQVFHRSFATSGLGVGPGYIMLPYVKPFFFLLIRGPGRVAKVAQKGLGARKVQLRALILGRTLRSGD